MIIIGRITAFLMQQLLSLTFNISYQTIYEGETEVVEIVANINLAIDHCQNYSFEAQLTYVKKIR